VISNKADAPGLQHRRRAWRADRSAGASAVSRIAPVSIAALAARIDAYQPDIVMLAGFMRVLTEAFVRHYANR
jgi:phosphoribosylglycinamide formyltransferase 1